MINFEIIGQGRKLWLACIRHQASPMQKNLLSTLGIEHGPSVSKHTFLHTQSVARKKLKLNKYHFYTQIVVIFKIINFRTYIMYVISI